MNGRQRHATPSLTAVIILLGSLLVGAGLDPASAQYKPDEYIWPSGVGPRPAEPALLPIDPYPWSAPLEDLRLKTR